MTLKNLFLVGALLAYVQITAVAVSAATVQEVFREAIAAYNAGDLETARTKLELVLANSPSHPAARAYLKRIELQQKQPRSIESLVASINLSNTHFKDATLDSVLQYLSEKASGVAGAGASVSFVSKLPATEMQSRRLTLSLANSVPLTEILRYVGELAGVTFRYDAHAIVVEDAKTQEPAAPVNQSKQQP